MEHDGSKVLEFNSNVEVLERAAKIIRAINATRFSIMNKDDSGLPLAKIEELVSHLITLYKEVMVEMNKDDAKELWDRLVSLRDRVESNPPSPTVEGQGYWRKTLHEIDDLEIIIRVFAKKHGFLSTNKLDARKAAARR